MGGGRYKSWRGVLAEQQCTGVGWGGRVDAAGAAAAAAAVDPLRVPERDRDSWQLECLSR